MTWDHYHSESERFASEAELAARGGDQEQAAKLYELAADAELCALRALDGTKPRTLGITVVSAVALYFKAHQYSVARDLAQEWVQKHDLPTFAVQQLNDTLKAIERNVKRERQSGQHDAAGASRDRVRILFLAANPLEVSRLRLDEEAREIDVKIRSSDFRDSFQLITQLAVRPSDLQEALMRYKPHIVHFSGHGNPAQGIILQDEEGNATAVKEEALGSLLKVLKDNIRIVVLNACYSKRQSRLITESVDYTIVMNKPIHDSSAIAFAAAFYRALAFGRTVKESFDLGVTEIRLLGAPGYKAPKLICRPWVNTENDILTGALPPTATGPSGSRPTTSAEYSHVSVRAGKSIGPLIMGPISNSTLTFQTAPASSPSGPLTFLPFLLATIAISLITDVARRFIGNAGDWPDQANTFVQPVVITLAVIMAALTVTSLVRPGNRLVEKAGQSGVFSNRIKPAIAAGLAGVVLFVTVALWLSLPYFARLYNEQGNRYHTDRNVSRALESYKRAIRLKPSYAQAHYNLAVAYEDLAQQEEAIKEYLLAIENDSSLFAAYNNLARLWIKRGNDKDYENALALLLEAIESSAPDERVPYSIYKNLGWASYKLKNYAQAESYLRRAILLQEERGAAAAHCLLAYVLKAQNKPGVLRECEDCVRFAPGEEDVEAEWLSDARECLMKGDIR